MGGCRRDRSQNRLKNLARSESRRSSQTGYGGRGRQGVRLPCEGSLVLQVRPQEIKKRVCRLGAAAHGRQISGICAAQQGVDEQVALQKGMEQKAVEFVKQGSQLYQKACTVLPSKAVRCAELLTLSEFYPQREQLTQNIFARQAPWVAVIANLSFFFRH